MRDAPADVKPPAGVAGGAVAKAILEKMGIDVVAYTIASHGLKVDHDLSYEEVKANYRKNEINCPDLALAEKMKEDVMKIKGAGDTAGGIIECIAHGVPAASESGVRQDERASRTCGLLHRRNQGN